MIPLLINGAKVTNSHTYRVFSHVHTSHALYKVSCLQSTSQVPEICRNSMKGFKEWSSISVSQRVQILQKASELLKQRKHEFVQSMEEIGSPRWFSEFNGVQLVQQLDEYIHQISNSCGEVIQTEVTDLAITVREPVGPVFAIAPWNAPGILTGRTLAAPLSAGCSVILKTTELAAKCGYLLVKCLLDAGVPPNTVQLVNVKPEDNKNIVKAFIEDENVRKISFTGSTSTGRQIAMVAAENLKPCVLELGGKNGFIIDADADIPRAVGGSLWGSWAHKGQICMSTDKIYIHESKFDEFKRAVDDIGTRLLEDQDYMIPQRTSGFARAIGGVIEDALSKGATIVFGTFDTNSQDTKNSQETQFHSNTPISPLVLTDITNDMKIHKQETFGPVVCVYKFKEMTELITAINSEKYGLKTSIWSRNVLKAQKYARQIESGGVHINSPTVYDEKTAPHGGVKESGYGRFNSRWGMDEFTYVKVITMSE